MERQGDEVHLGTEEARSAKSGMGVRYVLALSLMLVVVLFAAVWLIGTAGPKRSDQAGEATAPAPLPT